MMVSDFVSFATAGKENPRCQNEATTPIPISISVGDKTKFLVPLAVARVIAVIPITVAFYTFPFLTHLIRLYS